MRCDTLRVADTEMDLDWLREAVVRGDASLTVAPLQAGEMDDIAWSGTRGHLENVARQLRRVASGQVEYLAVRADGRVVSKGGIDFEAEPGAGTIFQLATHPRLQGIGLATRLIHELQARALGRGVNRLRLAVEVDDHRVRRLYEHLGYRSIGETDASWEAEAADGSRYVYATRLTEMEKVVERADP